MDFEFKMTGLAELEQKLLELPPRAAREALRAGIKAGGGILQDEMEERVNRGWHHFSAAPIAKGFKTKLEPDRIRGELAEVYAFLANHIAVRVTVSAEFEGAISIGPARAGYWAHFLEFGTSKMSAKPFIRPAFDTRGKDAVDEFAVETKAAIVRAGIPIT
jgi:HK97 gp10 family phage protein